MMEEVLTRCGYRCDLCLAYRPNVEANPSNREILSDGWHQYFGFRIPSEQIVCDGCMSEQGQLIDNDCPVRPCVIERGLESCARCADYGCEKIRSRMVVWEEVVASAGRPISPADRARFISPYENKVRLEQIRGLVT